MQTSLTPRTAATNSKLYMLLLLGLILVNGPLTERYSAAHPDTAERLFAPIGEELLENPLLAG
jgi:hypothetical protein